MLFTDEINMRWVGTVTRLSRIIYYLLSRMIFARNVQFNVRRRCLYGKQIFPSTQGERGRCRRIHLVLKRSGSRYVADFAASFHRPLIFSERVLRNPSWNFQQLVTPRAFALRVNKFARRVPFNPSLMCIGDDTCMRPFCLKKINRGFQSAHIESAIILTLRLLRARVLVIIPPSISR